LFDESWVRRGK